MQILDREHDRLRARPRQEPGKNRRQLPAAQFLRRERQRPLGRERNVDERRQQRNIFRRVEFDLRERRFEVGEAPFGRRFDAAEPLPPPVGDRMKRRILQELRRAPLDPCVRRIGEACAEFLDQARLAEARLADDHDELALAPARAVPAPEQHRHLVLAADERRQRPLAGPAAGAARAHDAKERRRFGRAFERMRAASSAMNRPAT